MERRTALAATVSLTATVVFGAVAFASLGGSTLLGFGDDAAAHGSVPVIVTDGTTSDGTVIDLTTVAAEAAGTPTGAAPNATAGQPTGARTPASTSSGASGPSGTTAGSTNTSGAGTSAATTVKATTTTPTTTATTAPAPVTTVRPQLYTVSGWLVPSNYTVPTKWWTRSIPDYPLGSYSKCKLEDEGWNCEN